MNSEIIWETQIQFVQLIQTIFTCNKEKKKNDVVCFPVFNSTKISLTRSMAAQIFKKPIL